MKLPPLEEMRLEFPGITLQDYEELQARPEVGVDEKKELETVTVDNTPKFTEANRLRMREWSERDREQAIRFLHSLDKHDVDAWRKLFEIIKNGIINKVPGNETEEKILSKFYLIEK